LDLGLIGVPATKPATILKGLAITVSAGIRAPVWLLFNHPMAELAALNSTKLKIAIKPLALSIAC
jgi:hypothetical protein